MGPSGRNGETMGRQRNAVISGKIVDPPELRFTPGGHPLLTFDLMVEAGKKSHVFHVVAWDAIAESISIHDEYFKADAKITIEGYLRKRTWINKSTGEKFSRLEYTIKEVIAE